MGFFFNQARSQAKKSASSGKKHIPIESMRQMGCKACPLDKPNENRLSPKMLPLGNDEPVIYVLGDMPNADGDEDNKPLTGDEARVVKSVLPAGLYQDLRLHNVIQCHIPGYTKGFPNEPQMHEIECCRGHITKDIEESKPELIVGMGKIPLEWATGLSGGISQWRGRLIAVKIGNHSCWYMPVFAPSHVLNKKKKWGRSEVELVFEHDWAEVIRLTDKKLSPPVIHEAPYDRGIEIITGESGSDFNRLEDLLNKLAVESKGGLDIETSGLRPYHANSKIYTAAVGTFENTVAFALDHPEAGWSTNSLRKVHGLFLDYLLYSGTKICHNLGFEQEWLAYHYGKELLRKTDWADTLMQAHTLDERPGKSLDDLTRQYFGFFLKDQSRVVVKDGRILEFPLKETLRYNGMDTKWTDKVYDHQLPLIEANKKYRVEYDRKLRLEPTLVLTQLKGVPVDFEFAQKLHDTHEAQLEKILVKINNTPEIKKWNRTNPAFTPSEPEQYSKLLKGMGVNEVITESGGLSSAEEILNALPVNEVPSASLVLEWRGIEKCNSTYLKPLLTRKVVSPDGKIHTRYNSMKAVSGRLTSEDPNSQNYPKRKFVIVRGVLVPVNEWLLACDYAQLEARVIAMASCDENLVKHLWTGYDIHGFWADRLLMEYVPSRDWIINEFNVDGDDSKLIRKTLRQEMKNRWVFPMFFGSNFRSCAESLHIPEGIAEDLSKEFWDEFPGVAAWQKKLLEKYEKNLYVETLSGRRRRGAMTKEEIINHPIQGSGADIVTEAMSRLSEMAQEIDEDEYQAVLNIHDDLTFDIADENLKERTAIIAKEMCRHTFDYINVPLIVEASVGDRWNTLKEVGIYKSYEMYPEIRNPYA